MSDTPIYDQTGKPTPEREPVHTPAATQTEYPWRATLRTGVQATIALAAAAPLIYTAATLQSAEVATGAVASFLFVCGAVTRVAALPVMEDFLQRFIPFLAAKPRNDA